MIERNTCLQKLIDSRNNGFPKVITGLRRCGKSYLLEVIYRKYLIDEGVNPENILIVRLDEIGNANLRNPIELNGYVTDYCKDRKTCYVFIDEIQMVQGIVNPIFTEGKIVPAKPNDETALTHVDVILGLSRKSNIDLYVTGSNSKMLSSDIITQFRDKATQISLNPLSFEEYCNYVGGYPEEALQTYLRYGGMPSAVLRNSEDQKKEYLTGLFEKTYFRDILERNNLKKGESLEELCNVISSASGELLNSQKIANTFLSVKNEKIDKHTVDKYLEQFRDSFLIREAKRYDVKGRTEIGALRKYYFTDLGLRNARLDFVYDDEGQLLENLVFNELVYNGYSVSVGTFDSVEKNREGKSVRKTYEIDFFARKNDRMYYLQVTSDLSNDSTRARELRPYFLLNDQIQKIIVLNRPVKECRNRDGFTVIGIADFLLRFIK